MFAPEASKVAELPEHNDAVLAVTDKVGIGLNPNVTVLVSCPQVAADQPVTVYTVTAVGVIARVGEVEPVLQEYVPAPLAV